MIEDRAGRIDERPRAWACTWRPGRGLPLDSLQMFLAGSDALLLDPSPIHDGWRSSALEGREEDVERRLTTTAHELAGVPPADIAAEDLSALALRSWSTPEDGDLTAVAAALSRLTSLS